MLTGPTAQRGARLTPCARIERTLGRMPSPIHLHTVADLLARNHTLQLYCLRCDRWRAAPLEQLAHRGLADRPITPCAFAAPDAARSPNANSARPNYLPPRHRLDGTPWNIAVKHFERSLSI